MQVKVYDLSIIEGIYFYVEERAALIRKLFNTFFKYFMKNWKYLCNGSLLKYSFFKISFNLNFFPECGVSKNRRRLPF